MTFPHSEHPVVLWVFVCLLQRPVPWLTADKLFLLPQQVSEPYGDTSFLQAPPAMNLHAGVHCTAD